MSPAEWEVRRLLDNPRIRHAARQLIDAARRDYVKRTAQAELEISRHFADLICPHCDQPFQRKMYAYGGSHRQRFCSDRCRKRAGDKRWRQREAVA